MSASPDQYRGASREFGCPKVDGVRALLGVGDNSVLIYHGQFGSYSRVTGPELERDTHDTTIYMIPYCTCCLTVPSRKYHTVC